MPLHSRQNNDEVQLYAFDILALDGEDLRSLPLSMRKTNLARLLARRPDGIFVAPSVALKTLGPYIEDATHLQTGKPFQNFGDMRSREAVANWLLCATANGIDGRILGALAD